MDASIIVALISSSASLVISISGTAWTARQDVRARNFQRELTDAQSQSQVELERLRHELQQADRDAEHQSQALARLETLREPLLVAAYELGGRIDNIQTRGFLNYLEGSGYRARTALLSTLHRFASYFAQQEALRAGLGFARLDDQTASAIADLLSHIGRTFATDKLDWIDSESPRFMFWREEQRAIGELMLDRADVVGYATFATRYDERFALWFAAFEADLSTAGAAEGSKRLERLRRLLAELVMRLDTDGVYSRPGSDGAPEWDGWVLRAVSPGNLYSYTPKPTDPG